MQNSIRCRDAGMDSLWFALLVCRVIFCIVAVVECSSMKIAVH